MGVREKSDSITHLVKIVAEEVFNTLMKNRLGQIKDKLKDEMLEMFVEITQAQYDTKKYLSDIHNTFQQSGQKWSVSEDKVLAREVDMFIKIVAANHRRTEMAIASRIRDKGLMFSGDRL